MTPAAFTVMKARTHVSFKGGDTMH
jgi:hypothetical protein